MDSIESIAAFSTAMSQTQVQSEVSIKVLKMAQGQDQMVADLLVDAMDSVQQSMESFNPDAGGQIDTTA